MGTFPLPVEVIPMAQAVVSRALKAMGATPILRLKEGVPYVTDNGCFIIDAAGLRITQPANLEQQINDLPGVVTNGLFARKGANVCLLGMADGVKTMTF